MRLITIVTGAASGIGRALVSALAQRNEVVLATDVDVRRLEKSAAEEAWPAERVVTHVHDVRSAESWSRTIEMAMSRWGRIDLLANVAGVVRPQYVQELSEDQIDLQLNVNTKGVILGTSAAVRVMAQQRGGHIVNVASMAALAPIPGISVYSASKFAVRGFTLAIAEEVEPLGITVSLVCPDAVATPMVDYQVDFPAAAMTFSGSRILSTDEVVRAIMRHAIDKRRLEVVMPWHRGLLAKSVTFLPHALVRSISGSFIKKGLARQEELRKSRGGSGHV